MAFLGWDICNIVLYQPWYKIFAGIENLYPQVVDMRDHNIQRIDVLPRLGFITVSCVYIHIGGRVCGWWDERRERETAETDTASREKTKHAHMHPDIPYFKQIKLLI